jgi:Family of unknown function (DUF5670)
MPQASVVAKTLDLPDGLWHPTVYYTFLTTVGLNERGRTMRFAWLVLGLMLLFAWIGGFVVYHVAGFMIHLLLIFAVIMLVIHLFSSRRSA